MCISTLEMLREQCLQEPDSIFCDTPWGTSCHVTGFTSLWLPHDLISDSRIALPVICTEQPSALGSGLLPYLRPGLLERVHFTLIWMEWVKNIVYSDMPESNETNPHFLNFSRMHSCDFWPLTFSTLVAVPSPRKVDVLAAVFRERGREKIRQEIEYSHVHENHS